jgi:hypothetical protein
MGVYGKYVDLGITFSKLQNPAQRRFLGLKEDDRGVLVSTVVAAGPSANVLRPVMFFLRSMIIQSRAIRM